MRKISLIIAVIVFVFFFVLPLNAFSMKDGGSTGFSPIIPWYEVTHYNRNISVTRLMSHNDPNYEPPMTRTKLKGTEVKLFGFVVYDGTYEVTEQLGG